LHGRVVILSRTAVNQEKFEWRPLFNNNIYPEYEDDEKKKKGHF